MWVLGAMFALIGFTAPAFALESYKGTDLDISALRVEKLRSETFEFYLGGALYDYDKVSGHSLWGKPKLYLLKSDHSNLGLMAYGGQGSGETMDHFEYDNSDLAAGLTMKSFGRIGDMSLDIGYGKHAESGSVDVERTWTDVDGNVWPVKGRSSSESDGPMLYASATASFYLNRSKERILLPKVDVCVTYFKYLATTSTESWTDVLDSKQSWTKSRDLGSRNSWDVDGHLWLVDLWVGQDLRLTPGLALGASSNVNGEKSTKYGVSLEVATTTWTILQVTFEQHTGDQKGSAVTGWVSLAF